jgi:hypothetical protein
MTEPRPEDLGETPTIEVRVYRDGRLIERELCESDEQAALAVEAWQEVEGVECEIDDLSIRHRPGDILEPEPADVDRADYPTAQQIDRSTGR